MNILQVVMAASVEEEYEQKIFKVKSILSFEARYGSLVMDSVILGLAVYFISIKRWQRFEWTIVAFMFIKYAQFAFLETQARLEYIEKGSTQFIVYITFMIVLGPICHWIYAS